MTPEQHLQARMALAADCEVRGVYLDANGDTCAIGGLALAAGVTIDALNRAEGMAVMDGDMELIRHAIFVRFGLTSVALMRIQWANDWYEDLDARRVAVLGALEKAYADGGQR